MKREECREKNNCAASIGKALMKEGAIAGEDSQSVTNQRKKEGTREKRGEEMP